MAPYLPDPSMPPLPPRPRSPHVDPTPPQTILEPYNLPRPSPISQAPNHPTMVENQHRRPPALSSPVHSRNHAEARTVSTHTSAYQKRPLQRILTNLGSSTTQSTHQKLRLEPQPIQRYSRNGSKNGPEVEAKRLLCFSRGCDFLFRRRVSSRAPLCQALVFVGTETTDPKDLKRAPSFSSGPGSRTGIRFEP